MIAHDTDPIEVGIQRRQVYACTDWRPGDGTGCGGLFRGALGLHRARCTRCERGCLTNVVRVTTRMLGKAAASA